MMMRCKGGSYRLWELMREVGREDGRARGLSGES